MTWEHDGGIFYTILTIHGWYLVMWGNYLPFCTFSERVH